MRAWFLLLPLALTACDPSADRIAASHGQTALDTELTGRSAGQPTDCIDVRSGTSLDIVDGSTLVYRAPQAIYFNRLGSACPGLRRTSRLAVEPALPGRYCRLDRIRVIDEGSSVAGATCPLGQFTAYARR